MSSMVFISLLEGECLMAMVQVTNPLDLMPITSILKENPLWLAMQKICGKWFSINAILALAKSEEKSITLDT